MIGSVGFAPTASRFPTERAHSCATTRSCSLASLVLCLPLGLQVVPIAQRRRRLLLVHQPLLDPLAADLAEILLAHHVVVELVLLRLVLGTPPSLPHVGHIGRPPVFLAVFAEQPDVSQLAPERNLEIVLELDRPNDSSTGAIRDPLVLLLTLGRGDPELRSLPERSAHDAPGVNRTRV